MCYLYLLWVYCKSIQTLLQYIFQTVHAAVYAYDSEFIKIA